ncbi:MAG: acyl-CoA dehydrogenase family protein [Chloroflexi bacterium]|nr:acyl-CoA dehydrogenase family protein [Chloroflexota bacterium]MCH7654910.1 acyl-CoA dehydrogenase family protein [Chloroflexota bacterium]
MAYQPIDLLDLDAQLTEEERQVRDAVRSFVEREAGPAVRDHFREGTFPMHLVPPMAALGIFGAPIEGYGCAGLGPIAHGLINRELERADSGFRSFTSVQSSLAMGAIHLHGSEEQRARYLPEMAAGRILGAFALTEAEHGSDPASMETRALKVSGGYEITGSKHWITNAGIAHVIIVWAKLDGTIRGFIVDTTLPGLHTHDIDNKLSMRMGVTSTIGLEGVVVPEECLLPGTKGLGSALACLNTARYGIIWGVTGAASDCLSQTLEYTKARHQFGKPLASFQLVQAKLADMATALSQAQLLAFQIGRLKEAGKLHWSHVSMAKYSNVRVALDIARTCRDLLGAAGITDDFSPLRHALNLETVSTYEGTQHMHQLMLGRHLTGFDAIS